MSEWCNYDLNEVLVLIVVFIYCKSVIGVAFSRTILQKNLNYSHIAYPRILEILRFKIPLRLSYS